MHPKEPGEDWLLPFGLISFQVAAITMPKLLAKIQYMANEEIAAIRSSGTECALERSTYASFSTQCWNASDMRLLAPASSNLRLPAAFGNLELVSQAPAFDVATGFVRNAPAEKIAEFRVDYTSREYLNGLERAVDKDGYNKFHKLQKEAEYFADAEKPTVIAQALHSEQRPAVSLESEQT